MFRKIQDKLYSCLLYTSLKERKYPSIAYELAEEIQKKTDQEVRITVPGHTQRGGSPCRAVSYTHLDVYKRQDKVRLSEIPLLCKM